MSNRPVAQEIASRIAEGLAGGPIKAGGDVARLERELETEFGALARQVKSRVENVCGRFGISLGPKLQRWIDRAFRDLHIRISDTVGYMMEEAGMLSLPDSRLPAVKFGSNEKLLKEASQHLERAYRVADMASKSLRRTDPSTSDLIDRATRKMAAANGEIRGAKDRLGGYP